MTPCESPTDPRLMAYAGFKDGFTMHDWCRRHYLGTEGADGKIIPCGCPCHADLSRKRP
jgi:hypothetical protein